MLSAGAVAPEFSVPASNGQLQSLASQRGRWVLLWWYPEAASSGCSVQAASLGKSYAHFEHAGITVWGISFNTVEKNDTFSCDLELGFPLLSDVDRQVGAAYDVMREPTEPFADKPRRVSYLIDPNGRIAFSELVPNDTLSDYGARALGQVEEAQAAATH